MPNETIVRLRILTNLHQPGEVSKLIGISCDASWKKGEPRTKGATIKHVKNAWILNSGCPASTPLDDQLIALLDRLKPALTEIRNLGPENEIELSCVLYSDTTPALNFSPAIIQAVAAMGASLDIDLYLG